MRWHFGGNLQPVRMICEYDWKECPIAVVSYIWSEIVTDVVDGLTGEAQLWRFLAIMLLCSMLLHTVYYKMRWIDKSEHDLTRDHLIKVGFKMQDLELKINILTYKMQYGIWPLPHEIPIPSLNQLKNIKLTLSSADRKNMLAKNHLEGYTSKCNENCENDKLLNRNLSMSEHMELARYNFLTQFERTYKDFDTVKSSKRLKLLHKQNDCKDYEKLLKTANECRNYMNEINQSNKSLGLFDNSSNSDQNSVKDVYMETESELNGHSFPIDPKKWHDFCKHKNTKHELGKSDSKTSNQIISMSNVNHTETMFPADNEQYTSKNSKNKSKLLPPGLSITFLSNKFKTHPSNEKCVIKNKNSTNQTLNKVKEKLENLRDSKSLSNIDGTLKYKKQRETVVPVKKKSCDGKYEKHNQISIDRNHTKFMKLENSFSTECDSSSDGNKVMFKSIPIRRKSEISSEIQDKSKEIQINQLNNQNTKLVHESPNKSFSDIINTEKLLDSNLNNMRASVESSWNISDEINKNSVQSPINISSPTYIVERKWPKSLAKEENLSTESDSSTLFKVNSISVQKPLVNLNGNTVKSSVNTVNNYAGIENNINLKLANKGENIISKMRTSYVLPTQEKSPHRTPMETDEDPMLVSQTSSQTEISKDSDMDDKSTTTLLREALEFKKALLMQIKKENNTYGENRVTNETSKCDYDDMSGSKTDNHFRPKLLDIISEEQSASSSTEKTSKTYLLSKEINGTNLHDNENNNARSLNSCKFMFDGECCGDSKSLVVSTSSEYFSINNITDNEHTSVQKINQCVADGDGLRGSSTPCIQSMAKSELELDSDKYEKSNHIIQHFDADLKKDKEKDENVFLESKSATTVFQESQDIEKKQDTIPETNYTETQQTSNEIYERNSVILNKLINVAKSIKSVKENKGTIEEPDEQLLDKLEEPVDSGAKSLESKSDAKIKFFRSLSSIDSKKAKSWNSLSESSSNESITQFMNTLVNLESKNIDTVTEQKLKMLNSTDYEGRNFAKAGENSRLNSIPYRRNRTDLVSFSDINISEHNHNIVDEILEMIANSAIFKQKKPKIKDTDSSNSNIITTSSTENHSEESTFFKSPSTLKLDSEKLQRKQDILSKLKSLDAFTKPLDISECGSEKNENEEEDNHHMTDRTVVCVSNNITTKNNETLSKIKSSISEDVSESSVKNLSSTSNVIHFETNENNKEEKNINLIGTSQVDLNAPEILTRQDVKCTDHLLKDDLNSEYNACIVQNSDSTCDVNLRNDKMISKSKKNQLSKSSVTNFSTDTSESYFDVSNHDFAVSSIILTSQNSNLASNHKGKPVKSDTSSSYVDASDYFSKTPSNSSSTQNDVISNLPEKKNNFSESQIVQMNTDKLEDKKIDQTDKHKKVGTVGNNNKSKHEALTRTQVMNKDASKRSSSLNLERSYSMGSSTLPRGKTTSKSCIPVLKSRIEIPKRGKSAEAKVCLQSPGRRSNISSLRTENSCPITGANSNNENEQKTKQSIHGNNQLLNRKKSYTLSPKNDTKQDLVNENEECKIVQSISRELVPTREKCNLLETPAHLTKECTVIYINIVSDADRNQSQTTDANEIIKYVSEKDIAFLNENLDSKCHSLSLKNITTDRLNDAKYAINSTSDSKLCKDFSNDEKNGNEIALTPGTTTASSDLEEKCSEIENNSERIHSITGNTTITGNKLLSSTLKLSNSLKIEKREIEVSAKPSVKSASTSVSDFPGTSSSEKPSFYNPKKEVFDMTKDTAQKEQIVLSEMLTTDPNFYECRKMHKLYNKLGLGYQEQSEQL